MDPLRDPAIPPAEPDGGVDEPPPTSFGAARRLSMAVAPFVGLALLFGVWELYVRVAGVRPLTLVPPSRVIAHVADEPGFYWRNGLVTVNEAFWGFVLALVAAMVMATVMSQSRFAERAGMPVVVLLQSIPVAVLVPVFILWFGFGVWPKIVTAALFAWIPFVSNALTGLRDVDPATHEVLRSVDASRWEIYWRLRIPHCLPYLFSAGRICIGLALVGAVIGEIFTAREGLGNAARVAQFQSLPDQLWGSVFVLAFIGVVAVLALSAVERRVLRWHSSQRLD